ASATAPGIARSTEAADIPDTARIGRTTGTTGYTAMTGNTGRTGAIATTTTEWTMVSDPECPTPYQLRASHQRTAAQGFFHRTECNGRSGILRIGRVEDMPAPGARMPTRAVSGLTERRWRNPCATCLSEPWQEH